MKYNSELRSNAKSISRKLVSVFNPVSENIWSPSMKKPLFLLLLILTVSSSAFSQTFDWAKKAGGNLNDGGSAIAVDTTGKSYVTGGFKNTITFPGCTPLTSTGGPDIFVAKFNSAGNCVWARQAKGLFNDAGNAISIDSMGNSYVTGIVGGGTVQFSSTQSITTTSSDDGFIAKYNSSGILQWVLRIGGPGLQYGSGIATQASTANFYVTGVFENSTIFNTTSGTAITLTSSGPPPQPSPFLSLGDIFVASYNTNGVLQWVKRAGGVNADYGYAVAVDIQNNAYVAGTFGSSFNWGGNSLTPVGLFDGFLAKYDPAGNLLWVRTMAGPNQNSATSISVDSSLAYYDGPYVTGAYSNSLTFSGSTISLTSPFPNLLGNNNEIFIARYDANGQLLWARGVGGPANDSPGGICVRHTTPFVVGSFTGTALFGGQSLTSAGGSDVFVARYDPNGALLWVRKAGGTLGDGGAGIGATVSGHAYITGSYSSNPAGFPGTGNLLNSNIATTNFFLAEIH
jgi:Beta-propeller repeat